VFICNFRPILVFKSLKKTYLRLIPESQVDRLKQLTEDGSYTSSETSDIYYPKRGNTEKTALDSPKSQARPTSHVIIIIIIIIIIINFQNRTVKTQPGGSDEQSYCQAVGLLFETHEPWAV
jgi:hypothetical protein